MIHIGKYGVSADSHGYMVGLIARAKDKKTGEEREYLTATRYPSTMQDCLRYIRKQMHYEAIHHTDGDLQDAVCALDAADKRFEQLIAGVERGGDP